MRFFICQDQTHLRLAQALRYEVYCHEKGWIDPAQFADHTERDEYDDLAVHFLAVDEDIPVGTSRLLLGSLQPLPAADYIDLAKLGLDPRDCVEVSRMATHPMRRSQDLKVFLGLNRAMWHWSMERRIKAWLAIADVPLFRLLKRLRMPIIADAPPIDYLGSPCVPAAFDLVDTGVALGETLAGPPPGAPGINWQPAPQSR